MSNLVKGLIVFAVLAVVVVCGVGMSVLGTHDTFVAFEEGLEAQYKQNQNNYDNYFKTVKEAMQVTDAYSSDFKKSYDSFMKGRYGQNGSQATMQWIKETVPNLDPSMYKDVQNVIKAGRKDFEMNQKTLLDKKRVYKTELNSLWGRIVGQGVWGFPKKPLDVYDIVTSGETEEAFSTKKSNPIKLR